MDVSSLPEETALGARFYDEGKEGDALEILKKYGANSLRIRLWNDPWSESGESYGAGENDLKTTLASLTVPVPVISPSWWHWLRPVKSWVTAICWICITVISGQIPANSFLPRSGRMPVRMHWRSMCMITQRMCF